MRILPSVEKCTSYIECQLQSAQGPRLAPRWDAGLPAITISRQTGARGTTIGMKLAEYLRYHDKDASCPWTLFDKDLVKTVLEQHHLPTRLAEFMPEDKIGEIEGIVGEILGLHPSLWELFHHTTQTILRLACMGHVILVGRGSNIITAQLKNVVHVRLIGSLQERIAHMREVLGVDDKAVVDYIREEDSSRRRFMRTHFSADINDPNLYDLVINTDRLADETVVKLIADLVKQKRNSQQD